MNKLAFTLFETLIVLFLLSIMLLLLNPQILNAQVQYIEEKLFIESLVQGLKFAQQRAVLQNINIRVEILNQSIQFKDSGFIVYQELVVPDHLKILKSFNFDYNRSGRIGSYEPIRFLNIINNQTFQVTLQLGNGQFEIQR